MTTEPIKIKKSENLEEKVENKIEGKTNNKKDIMTIGTYVFIILMIVILIGLSMYSSGLEQDLSNTKWDYKLEKKAHNETVNMLYATSLELSNISSVINETNSRYLEIESKYKSIYNDYNKTSDDLGNANKEIITLNDKISDLEKEIDLYKNGDKYHLSKQTYEVAKSFWENDKTDENEYINDTYNCMDFAADFIKNAKNEGIYCGLAYVRYDGGAHALVIIPTLNKGLVYLEPQNDSEYSSFNVGSLLKLKSGDKVVKSILKIY